MDSFIKKTHKDLSIGDMLILNDRFYKTTCIITNKYRRGSRYWYEMHCQNCFDSKINTYVNHWSVHTINKMIRYNGYRHYPVVN